MKKKISIILIIFAGFIGLNAIAPVSDYFEIAKNLDIFTTLFKEVNAYYVDEVDPENLANTGMDAMLESLDPYTDYIPENQLESFRTATTGQYAGIGIMVRNMNQRVMVTRVYEGFSAYKGGLQIGDQILSVNGKKVQPNNIPEIGRLLKGLARSTVEVDVLKAGKAKPTTLTLERENIKVVNVPVYEMVSDHTGYIKLEEFTSQASQEVVEALRQLKAQGASHIILDLRGNPGGLLSEAIDVSNIFIPKGKEIVSTRGKVKEWNKTYRSLNQAEDTNTPLALLIDGSSASASEIVAGVIQDYDRGILIGNNTFGKGLVQTTRPLKYDSRLKVTTAKYYIPSGRCIQAVDYTNRDENGQAETIADSLRIPFKTERGRVVYDGSGIQPDIPVDEVHYASITQALLSQGHLFEYANVYKGKHESLVDARNFRLGDQDFNDFKSWLSRSDFSYNTELEKGLQQLEFMASEEKYLEDINREIRELRKQISTQKGKDLKTFWPEISVLLTQEIASRYHYYKGAVVSVIDDDPDIQMALRVLENATDYNRLLQQ